MKQKEKRKCWRCGGSGEQVCSRCNGTGVEVRLELSPISIWGVPLPTTVPCQECKGTKMTRCSICHGTGKI